MINGPGSRHVMPAKPIRPASPSSIENGLTDGSHKPRPIEPGSRRGIALFDRMRKEGGSIGPHDHTPADHALKVDPPKPRSAHRQRTFVHITGSRTTKRKSARSTSASVCWVKRKPPSRANTLCWSQAVRNTALFSRSHATTPVTRGSPSTRP